MGTHRRDGHRAERRRDPARRGARYRGHRLRLRRGLPHLHRLHHNEPRRAPSRARGVVDVADPGERYGANRCRDAVLALLPAFAARARVPLFVGGTGVYLRAALEGLCRRRRRSRLRRWITALGRALPGGLRPLLGRVDAAAAARIHPNDAFASTAPSRSSTLGDDAHRAPAAAPRRRAPAARYGSSRSTCRRRNPPAHRPAPGRDDGGRVPRGGPGPPRRGVDPALPALRAVGYPEFSRTCAAGRRSTRPSRRSARPPGSTPAAADLVRGDGRSAGFRPRPTPPRPTSPGTSSGDCATRGAHRERTRARAAPREGGARRAAAARTRRMGSAGVARRTRAAGRLSRAEVVGTFHQRRDRPDPATLIGSGKAAELAELLKERGANLALFEHELTPGRSAICPGPRHQGLDRTDLILDIFAQRARSREGRLQVEVAQLARLLPRLVGKGLALSRLGGGIGTRGPGEKARGRPAPRAGPAGGAAPEDSRARADRAPSSVGAQGPGPRRRARGVHQRRQVDAPQRPLRQQRRGRGPAVLDPRPNDPPHRAAGGRRLRPHRHGRFHQAHPAPAHRGFHRHARRAARSRPAAARHGRQPPRPRGAAGDRARVLRELDLAHIPRLEVYSKIDRLPPNDPFRSASLRRDRRRLRRTASDSASCWPGWRRCSRSAASGNSRPLRAARGAHPPARRGARLGEVALPEGLRVRSAATTPRRRA